MNAIAGCSSFWYVPNALLYDSQSTLHLWPGNATHTVPHWKANHDFDTLSSSLLELMTASDSEVEWKTWFLYWLSIHKAQPNLYVGATCLGRKIFAAILSIRCFWGVGGSEKRKREKAPPSPLPILNLLSPSPLGRPDTQAILSPIWRTLLFATLPLPDKSTLRWRNLALLRLLRRQAEVKTTRHALYHPVCCYRCAIIIIFFLHYFLALSLNISFLRFGPPINHVASLETGLGKIYFKESSRFKWI